MHEIYADILNTFILFHPVNKSTAELIAQQQNRKTATAVNCIVLMTQKTFSRKIQPLGIEKVEDTLENGTIKCFITTSKTARAHHYYNEQELHKKRNEWILLNNNEMYDK